MCMLLAAGRQQMVERAIRCFQSQTYQNRVLAVVDNGQEPLQKIPGATHWTRTAPGKPIGELRNLAAALSLPLEAEIIAHWDSDDWSAPERLTEQIALLQESGAPAAGYHEMLFWDSTKSEAWLHTNPVPNYVLGTSLVYWRTTWEKHPFPEVRDGEETRWLLKVKAARTTAFCSKVGQRMIAQIHGSNTCARIVPGAREWKRAPEWDSYCREVI